MALPDIAPPGGPPPELVRSANRVDFVLPAADGAVTEARHRVQDHIDAWHIDADSRDTAVLVMSELVTNAVVHTDSSAVTCVLAATETQVLVQVEDEGTSRSAPVRRRPSPQQQGGRGLFIVETVSCSWGTSRLPDGHGGHVVWAVLQVNGTADR